MCVCVLVCVWRVCVLCWSLTSKRWIPHSADPHNKACIYPPGYNTTTAHETPRTLTGGDESPRPLGVFTFKAVDRAAVRPLHYQVPSFFISLLDNLCNRWGNQTNTHAHKHTHTHTHMHIDTQEHVYNHHCLMGRFGLMINWLSVLMTVSPGNVSYDQHFLWYLFCFKLDYTHNHAHYAYTCKILTK